MHIMDRGCDLDSGYNSTVIDNHSSSAMEPFIHIKVSPHYILTQHAELIAFARRRQ